MDVILKPANVEIDIESTKKMLKLCKDCTGFIHPRMVPSQILFDDAAQLVEYRIKPPTYFKGEFIQDNSELEKTPSERREKRATKSTIERDNYLLSVFSQKHKSVLADETLQDYSLVEDSQLDNFTRKTILVDNSFELNDESFVGDSDVDS